MAAKMEACSEELNALDRQVGDGDIGITLTAGFRGITEIADQLSDDVGASLLACAEAFAETRASSFGTLFARGIMAAAGEVQGETAVAWTKISILLEKGIERMARLGKSSLGDKTVLDMLEAIRLAVLAKSRPEEILEAAHQAATLALEEFRFRACKQGRARIFAEQTVGLNDPGMVVIQKLVEALWEARIESPAST